MTTINWVIEWMNASTQTINGHDKVVLTAGWRCNGIDGIYNATTYGSCSFDIPKIGESFTPYDQLNQNQVLQWIWSNNIDKNEIETNITSQIQNSISPTEVQLPLPWKG
jgi:hypothetical protein